MTSEWMKVMLEEIARKKAESEQARIEAEQARIEAEQVRIEAQQRNDPRSRVEPQSGNEPSPHPDRAR
jgi:hypothetical protein